MCICVCFCTLKNKNTHKKKQNKTTIQGKFHYRLIFLCGLGYISDNMWGEAISLIIAPIQNEFEIGILFFVFICFDFL